MKNHIHCQTIAKYILQSECCGCQQRQQLAAKNISIFTSHIAQTMLGLSIFEQMSDFTSDKLKGLGSGENNNPTLANNHLILKGGR